MNTTPTKILFVLPALTAGGAERVIITLMNGLNNAKFTPYFLTISENGDLKDLIDSKIPFRTLKSESLIKSVPNIYKTIKDIDPEMIVSTMAHMNFTLLFIKPLFPNKKFIVREAITPSFLFNKYRYGGFLIKLLYKNLYKKADIVLSPSQIIFDEFRDILRMESKNFIVLPNPVDTDRISQIKIDNKSITKERKKTVQFLAAGRLGKQKGFDRLIEYLPSMNLQYDWHITIIGEGSERTNLEELIKKHSFEEKISLPGLVRPPWKNYMNADCFLMPSRFEGLPNVVLESLACGTPVIATKESGGIEYIADLAGKKAVHVTSSMNNFIKEMEKARPNPSASAKKSLLPQTFYQKSVFSQFESILDNA